MTVYDLNREQLNELKQSYSAQLEDCGDGNSYYELIKAEDIPDDVIFYHYGGVIFSDDDFFCSSKKDYKYYQVTFRRHANLSETYSICIKAKRRPDYDEAQKFCKEYKKDKYDYLDNVCEITEDEAYKLFGVDNKTKLPIFEYLSRGD